MCNEDKDLLIMAENNNESVPLRAEDCVIESLPPQALFV